MKTQRRGSVVLERAIEMLLRMRAIAVAEAEYAASHSIVALARWRSLVEWVPGPIDQAEANRRCAARIAASHPSPV